MQISTKLGNPTGRDCAQGSAGALLRGGPAGLVGRADGLVRKILRCMSNAVVEGLSQLRSRLEEVRAAGGRRRRMRVVESLALGGRRQLLLVRCDEQEYLVGTGPDSVETIVLRQPEGGAGPTGTGTTGIGFSEAGKAAPVQAGAKTRYAGVNTPRPGVMFRERPEHGPWLVTAPEMVAMTKNRVREVDGGQGRGSWQ